LYVREDGNPNAPIILFLHGGGMGGWMWEKQLEYFKDFYCLTPDLQGHGKSIDNTHFSINNCVDELIKLIEEKQNGKQLFAVGFSLGSQVLLELVSKRPDCFNSIILISALVRPMKCAQKVIKFIIPMSMTFLKSRSFRKLQSKILYIGDELSYEHSNSLKILTSDILIETFTENMSFSIPKSFSTINVKTLVIVGEKENRAMIKSAKDLCQSNQNTQVLIIPKIGHGFSLAAPDKFNKLAESWFNHR
jgi:pimeloyl-ACP methyl ester carboxylesterase